MRWGGDRRLRFWIRGPGLREAGPAQGGAAAEGFVKNHEAETLPPRGPRAPYYEGDVAHRHRKARLRADAEAARRMRRTKGELDSGAGPDTNRRTCRGNPDGLEDRETELRSGDAGRLSHKN